MHLCIVQHPHACVWCNLPCCNGDMSSRLPRFQIEIFNFLLCLVSDKLGLLSFLTFTHTHLGSFVLLTCTLTHHYLSTSFFLSFSISPNAWLLSFCKGGLVCIEANPLMLNVSRQLLRPHGFHRRLPVCPVVVCVWWHLCLCVKGRQREHRATLIGHVRIVKYLWVCCNAVIVLSHQVSTQGSSWY